ncbi:MAG: hypothetical protein MMC23_003169 [Stictis urceolatum]|nr:hypothetical protein [Stictis urceolata]
MSEGFHGFWGIFDPIFLSANSLDEAGLVALVKQTLQRSDRVGAFARMLVRHLGKQRYLFFVDPMMVGSGPLNATKGDCIATIAGVSVPLILRETSPCSQKYMIIGPAFVASLMEWGWTETTKERWWNEYVEFDNSPSAPTSTVARRVSLSPWPESEAELQKRVPLVKIDLV